MFDDLRLALRSLLRRPTLLVTSVLILGLGIGATVAVFSVVHGVLLAPLPYTEGEDLVVLRQSVENDGSGKAQASVPFSIKEVEDLRAQNTTLSGVVEHHAMTFTLLGHGEARRVSTGVVSADFFDVLGVRPEHGRGFLEADDATGAEAVLVLSYPYFMDAFGGDESVVGQVFEMNNRPHTVVGVLPPIPQFPQEHDVYMPTSACPFRAGAALTKEENRGAFRALTVFGRLGTGSTLENVGADLGRMAGVFTSDFPDTYQPDAGYSLRSESLKQALVTDSRSILWMLGTAAGLLLLLACSSVANLLVVRAMRATTEQALRAALGASRARLLRRSLAESVIIALFGAGAAMGVAVVSVGVLRAFLGRYTPRADTVSLNVWVFAFACGVALLVAVGVTVIQELSRSGGFAALREGTRAMGGRRAGLVRGGLIVAQVAVAVLLLAGTGLLIKSLYLLQNEETGVAAEEVVTARLSLNWRRYPNSAAAQGLYNSILQRLEDHPQVSQAALGSNRPMDGQAPFVQGLMVEGLPPVEGEVAPQAAPRTASEGYFEILGIRLLEGRTFQKSDDMSPQQGPVDGGPAEHHRVAILNRAARDLFLPGLEPIGRRVSLNNGTNWWTVVGVVADVRHDLDESPVPAVYLPLRQNGIAGTLLVQGREGADSALLQQTVVGVVKGIDTEQPVDQFKTVASAQRELTASPRTVGKLLSLFAIISLLVAAVGLGGLVAYTVAQRQREIGVRIALGAEPAKLVLLMWRQGLLLVLLGVAVGLLGTALFGDVLKTFLYGTAPQDPLTLSFAVLAVFTVGAVASLLPALRATKVEPTAALRG